VVGTPRKPAAAHLVQHLLACGIQPTAQRLQVADLLLATRQHVTAEQLLAALRSRGARVSKATLYNTLRLFAERGLVRELSVDGVRAWFDSNVAPHYHFRDETTGSLTDVGVDEVAFGRLPEPPPGMEISGVDLVIRLRPARTNRGREL
jgi:Fur family iron response transcriptional regulator